MTMRFRVSSRTSVTDDDVFEKESVRHHFQTETELRAIVVGAVREEHEAKMRKTLPATNSCLRAIIVHGS